MTRASIRSAISAALTGLAFLACASPESRIKKHQAAFDAYPPEVRQRIREGKIETGFTAEQVELALGTPDRKYSRKSESSVQEIWAYGRGGGVSSGVELGVGMPIGGSAMTAVGIGLGTGRDEATDRLRVVMENGRVVSVERLER